MNQNNNIHLGIAIDQNYVTLFYVLLTSVFYNNKKNKITVHIIATGVDEVERNKMAQFVKEQNGEICFYDFDPNKASDLYLKKHLTVACYYRLYLPALVPPEIDRLLYLDTDIVIIGDLLDLYKTDFKGLPAAIVNYPAAEAKPELNIENPGDYFNSGVMLMNLSEWKGQHISERAIEFVQQNPEKCKLSDQDGLNAVLVGNYLKLPLKYNVTLSDIPDNLGKKKHKEFLKDKVVIHFTRGGHKPWKILGKNKFRYLYHYYLKKSPKKNERKYSDFSLKPKTLAFYLKIRTEERIVDFPLAYQVYKKVVNSVK